MTQVHEHGSDVVRADVDDRPRARRLVAPTATALGVIIATGIVARVDPNQPGHYPLCPTAAFFGIDCPACGGLRATHALANGDVLGAMDHNILFVLLVPFLIGAWFVWFWRAWTGRRPADTPLRRTLARVLPIVLVFTMLIFGVVRNFVPYLGAGVG